MCPQGIYRLDHGGLWHVEPKGVLPSKANNTYMDEWQEVVHSNDIIHAESLQVDGKGFGGIVQEIVSRLSKALFFTKVKRRYRSIPLYIFAR